MFRENIQIGFRQTFYAFPNWNNKTLTLSKFLCCKRKKEKKSAFRERWIWNSNEVLLSVWDGFYFYNLTFLYGIGLGQCLSELLRCGRSIEFKVTSRYAISPLLPVQKIQRLDPACWYALVTKTQVAVDVPPLVVYPPNVGNSCLVSLWRWVNESSNMAGGPKELGSWV